VGREFAILRHPIRSGGINPMLNCDRACPNVAAIPKKCDALTVFPLSDRHAWRSRRLASGLWTWFGIEAVVGMMSDQSFDSDETPCWLRWTARAFQATAFPIPADEALPVQRLLDRRSGSPRRLT